MPLLLSLQLGSSLSHTLSLTHSLSLQVARPTDASQWELENCFPQNWPNKAVPESDDDDDDADEERGESSEIDAWRRNWKDHRPGDMVIYRLFVSAEGLEGGPAELRDVVRRALEKSAAARQD